MVHRPASANQISVSLKCAVNYLTHTIMKINVTKAILCLASLLLGLQCPQQILAQSLLSPESVGEIATTFLEKWLEVVREKWFEKSGLSNLVPEKWN